MTYRSPLVDLLLELHGAAVSDFLDVAAPLLAEVEPNEHADTLDRERDRRPSDATPPSLSDMFESDTRARLVLVPRVGTGRELAALASGGAVTFTGRSRRRAEVRAPDEDRPVLVRLDHWDARETALALACRILAWDDMLTGRAAGPDRYGTVMLPAAYRVGGSVQPRGPGWAPAVGAAVRRPSSFADLMSGYPAARGGGLHLDLQAVLKDLAAQALRLLDDGPFGEPFMSADPAAGILATLIADAFGRRDAWLGEAGIDLQSMAFMTARHPDWVPGARLLAAGEDAAPGRPAQADARTGAGLVARPLGHPLGRPAPDGVSF